jgi:predicted ester cyclase
MLENKNLINDYLRTLSGRAKTRELVRRFVADEALAKHIADVEAAFPNYEIITKEMLAEGDKVVVRGDFRGTHRGQFAGIEPTGKNVSAGLIIIYAVRGGKIVDHWMQFDMLRLFEQLRSSSAAA